MISSCASYTAGSEGEPSLPAYFVFFDNAEKKILAYGIYSEHITGNTLNIVLRSFLTESAKSIHEKPG